MRKDQANTMPPMNSSWGTKGNGKRSDSADIESEGGDIPNITITWDRQGFDRMEGSIIGKNKPQKFQ